MTAFRDTERARKLLGLWRGAQGGEKDKARGALMRVLESSGLTLRDLEAGLPPSRDPLDSLAVRAAERLLAQLSSESATQREAALSELTDMPGLSASEREQVLQVLDIARLAAQRAEGWALGQRDPEVSPALISQAATGLSESEVARFPAADIASSVRDLSVLRAAQLARPARQLSAQNEWEAAFVSALASGLSGVPASTTGPNAQGHYSVQAHLSPNELSQVRARQAREQAGLRRELLRAARLYGKQVAAERW